MQKKMQMASKNGTPNNQRQVEYRKEDIAGAPKEVNTTVMSIPFPNTLQHKSNNKR